MFIGAILCPLVYEYRSKQIIHELGISSATVTATCTMLRDVCKIHCGTDSQIGGPGRIVQIDESHMYTRKYNVGRVLKTQTWVFGGIDCSDGRMFLEQVEHRNASTLSEVLQRRVRTGSVIFSDSWRGYTDVPKMFDHHQVNHSKNFVRPIHDTNTQKIEAMWGVLKRLLRMKGARKCTDLDGYLSEFIWRNRTRNTPFASLLCLLKQLQPSLPTVFVPQIESTK